MTVVHNELSHHSTSHNLTQLPHDLYGKVCINTYICQSLKKKRMISFPNAKINLGLNVVSKRPDGYHNIETIFYPIPVKDAL